MRFDGPVPFLSAAVIGILANFLFFSIDQNGDAEVFSAWRLSADSTGEEFSEQGLKEFVGVTQEVETVSEPEPVNRARTYRRFSYGGVVYRLSGLVVAEDFSAATLIGENQEMVRLGPGESIPSGETVVSIGLSQLVLINKDGEQEVVEIY